MAFEYPNGPGDHDGILRYAEDIAGSNRTFWTAVEAQAWKNILAFLGHFWITWSDSLRFWRPLGLSEDKPRPVTNRIKPLINDVASKLVAWKPPITWGPGSDQDADYVAASVADRVNTAIEREADLRTLKPLAARWLGLTGNVFVVSTYDTSPETGTRFIQSERCLQCGMVSTPGTLDSAGNVCPGCGSVEMQNVEEPDTGLLGQVPVLNPRFEPAIGQEGKAIGVSYPRGRHLIELENVFTTRFEPQCVRFHQSPYARIARTREKAWVAERYGDEFAEQVAYGRFADPFSSLFDSIALTAMGGRYLAQTGSEAQRVLVQRLWIRPHPTKAPQGIHATIIGDRVRESGPYPYQNERGEAMLNVAHLEFDQVTGRALASTRCDDAVQLNQEVNELDAYIRRHHRAMSNAVWLIPAGSDPTRIKGDPDGIYVRYNPLATGHRPERAQGVMVPADIYQYREFRKREIDEVFGLYEVGRGEAPRGVSAYAALQLLDERAQQGQSNLFDNWALGWMEVSRQNINIWREYADEERTMSLGVGRWATRKFNKAQMIGGVDVDVELGQNRPRTMVAKRAVIGQAIQEGAINIFDPQVRFLVLKALGIPELMPNVNKDYERAGRIVDRMVEAQSPEQLPGPPFPFDNHAIHLDVLQSLIKDEAFEELEPWKQQAIVLRAQIHYQALREDVLQQMSGPGQFPPRIGGKNGGGGRAAPYSTEQDTLDRETQGASPETLTGAPAKAFEAGT